MKSVFKDSNTQKLQKNTSRNSQVISDINQNLEEMLIKNEKSVTLRKAKLGSELEPYFTL